MSKTSTTVKDRWNRKNYDDIRVRLPKGCKKAVEAHAQQIGESVNGLVNALLRAEMGLSEAEWKRIGFQPPTPRDFCHEEKRGKRGTNSGE